MSWYQLLGIAQQAEFEKQYELQRTPSACPNDGEPLMPGPDGELFCTFDGYQWPRDGKTGAGYQT